MGLSILFHDSKHQRTKANVQLEVRCISHPLFPTIIQDIENRVSGMHCVQGGALSLEVRESEADTRPTGQSIDSE